LEGFAVVAFAFADIALDVDIGEEIHLDDIYPLSTTGFAASAFDVEGKLSRFVAACFGFDGLGEDFADGIEYACVGDGIRSRAVLLLTSRSTIGTRSIAFNSLEVYAAINSLLNLIEFCNRFSRLKT
jgi:hypothetical protein